MAHETTVHIDATRYQDEDDCLMAAATDYAAEHDLAGWDLAPRWLDDQREVIVLTVPVTPISAAAATLGRRGGQAGTEAQNAARRANGKKGGRPKMGEIVRDDE